LLLHVVGLRAGEAGQPLCLTPESDRGEGQDSRESGQHGCVESDRVFKDTPKEALAFYGTLFCGGVVGAAVLMWGLARLDDGRRLLGVLAAAIGGLIAFFGPLSLAFPRWPLGHLWRGLF
jgi:hypothetical protein